MKMLLKMSLSAAMFVLAVPFAFSESDVLNLVEGSRKLSNDALKNYTLSLQKLNNAETVVELNLTRFAVAQGDLDSIENRSQNNQLEIKRLSETLAENASDFVDACTFLESSKQNLQAANAVLPIGQARLELGEKLCAELAELTAKDPGKDYRDKYYANSITVQFVRAKSEFLTTHAELSQELVSASISAPRINGIKSFMKLSESYLAKAEEIKDKNLSNLNPLKSEFEALLKSATLSLNELNENLADFRLVKIDFIKSRIALDDFVMNKLPKIENGKYYEHTFKADSETLSALFASTFKKSKIDGGSTSLFGFEPAPACQQIKRNGVNKAKNEQGAPSGSLIAYEDVKLSSPDKKSIRSEIIEKCNALANLTCEISSADSILKDIVKEAKKSQNKIEQIESTSQSALRSAIEINADTQSLSSEIEIFKGKLQVVKVQGQISQDEFNNLCKASKTARTNSENDIAKLKENLTKLNSLK